MQNTSTFAHRAFEKLCALYRSNHPPTPLEEVSKQWGFTTLVRVDGDSVAPWIFGICKTLPSPAEQKSLEDTLSKKAPSHSFLVWLFDEQGSQRLVLSVHHGRARWQQENHGERPLKDNRELQRLLQGKEPPPIRLVRAAHLLQRKDLSHRFYRDIQRAVQAIEDGWNSSNPLSDSDRHRLAMTLIARLLFLHFIQAKGWLPNESFLQHFGNRGDTHSYINDWTPLFFDALNLPADERISGRIPDAIPYLNGGLFSPTALERAHPALELPNDVLYDRVLSIFARYRFSDDEHHTQDAAIAPQLLGELFEGLMERKDRQRTGAFYTPPELARSCFQDTLANYLEHQGFPTIRKVLDEKKKLTVHEAEALIPVLMQLRILDPAVGTGAFLLAALLTLEALTLKAYEVLQEPAPSAYALRAHWVTHSLHGVDIHPDAITLTELRLWLCVTAASTASTEQVAPLPNLAHRLRTGDSILPPLWRRATAQDPHIAALEKELRDTLTAFSTLRGNERNQALAAIRALETTLVEEHRQRRRAELEQQERAQTQLFNGTKTPKQANQERKQLADDDHWQRTGAFDPKLHFADVMHEGGFDLIIGNPPWTPTSRLPAESQQELKSRYICLHPKGQRTASVDVSLPFFEAMLPLLKKDGRLAFLFPSKAIRAGWGAAWRKWIEHETTVFALHAFDTQSTHGFKAAAYPAFTILGHAQPGHQNHVTWLPSSQRRAPHTAPLSSVFRVRYGIKTGANAIFVNPPAFLPHVLPAVRGRDLDGDDVQDSTRLLFAHGLKSAQPLPDVPPRIKEYLQPMISKLRARSDWRDSDPDWRVYRTYPEGHGWRVAWPDIAVRMRATVLPPVQEGGPLCLNTVYFIGVDSQDQAMDLADWLNSEEPQMWMLERAQVAQNGYLRFDARLVGSVPLPPPDHQHHLALNPDYPQRALRHSFASDSRSFS